MDRSIYLSMTGAKTALLRQELVAHNLANASSTGCRAELDALRSVPLRGEGATTRAYALSANIGHDDRTGPVESTGRPLDVALIGRSWLSVQAPDGTEAYTRNGALHVDATGLIVTQAGWPVVGDGGPLTVPEGASVEVSPDGRISATIGEAAPVVIGRLKLVTPQAPLTRGLDGLFRSAEGELPADANARVQSEALEGSNVNTIETMAAMIALHRHFEQQMKALEGAEQRGQTAARLLSPP